MDYYIGFISSHRKDLFKYERWNRFNDFVDLNYAFLNMDDIHSNKILYVSGYNCKNLSDHMMSSYLFYCLGFIKDRNVNVNIITRDKSGLAILYCLSYMLKNENVNLELKLSSKIE